MKRSAKRRNCQFVQSEESTKGRASSTLAKIWDAGEPGLQRALKFTGKITRLTINLKPMGAATEQENKKALPEAALGKALQD
jgi:hypothetical protein